MRQAADQVEVSQVGEHGSGRRAAWAFDDLYRSDFTSVVGLVYGLSGSRWAAEELAQEAFFAAHRRWDEIQHYDDPGAWVRRVAMNRAVSVLRRRSAEARAMARFVARQQVLPESLPPDDGQLWAAVRRLPRRQAQVLVLHYAEDCSVEQIARVLDVSEGTVKTHLHRGREAVAARLGIAGSEKAGRGPADEEGGER